MSRSVYVVIDEDAVWALIAMLRRDPHYGEFARLTDLLAVRTEHNHACAERTAEALRTSPTSSPVGLYALDMPAHFAALWPLVIGDGPFPHARSAAVAADRKVYENALERLWLFWSLQRIDTIWPNPAKHDIPRRFRRRARDLKHLRFIEVDRSCYCSRPSNTLGG